MFNRTPACDFWTGFPFDHDAYIAADGTDDYAVRLFGFKPIRILTCHFSTRSLRRLLH